MTISEAKAKLVVWANAQVGYISLYEVVQPSLMKRLLFPRQE